jgi:HK97 family phage prohead protease
MTTSIVRKDALASIAPGDDEADQPNGSFHIILSTAAKDRDGEELQPDEWEQPLPDRITMDADHGMSVASTVGSGVPTIEDGQMHVRGAFASTPLGQQVRSLVKEGHITKTSVAFLRKSATDDKGVKKVSRELLNGAFVAVPANDEARVLASKTLKEGRRNSAGDAKAIQAIHDHTADLGALCAGGKAARKDADTQQADDPGALAQGVDAAIDQAIDLLAAVDATTLPEPVQQAIALIQSADATVDQLLDALGVADPDDDDQTADAADAAKAASAASAAELAALPDRLAAARTQALGALADIYAKTGA